jgi:S-disulfanyl-L-cysteine oxidoreductase SoxD
VFIYVSSQHVLDSSHNTPVIESGIGTRQTTCRRAPVETALAPLNNETRDVMISSWRRLVRIVSACLLSGSVALALQTGQTLNNGIYTDQQATRGQTLYQKRCSACHSANLAGRTGPPLTGDDFLSNWDTRPLLELANKILKTMPKDDTDALTPQESADLLAYILQSNKFPSGRVDLILSEAALKDVTFPRRARTQPKPAPDAPPLSLPAAGNVAQVMRGILFPSANLLFSVQSIDPGSKKPAANAAAPTGAVDWLTWGGSVYRGWEMVDYAAISIAESATLMLTPGRRCENGKSVPVTDPDWIKFTQQLADAGTAAYRASQTRNQEIASESTNQLNDSCMSCHRVFRGRTHCVKP